jgi:hypothetical protein
MLALLLETLYTEVHTEKSLSMIPSVVCPHLALRLLGPVG